MSTEPKKLGEYLIERGLVRPEAVESALMEQRISGEPLGLILVRNGFLAHQHLIETIIELAPERIIREQVLTSTVPPDVLSRHRILLTAETETHIYAATLSPEPMVRSILEPYFPGRKLVFVSASPDLLDEYMNKVDQMAAEEGSMIDLLLRKALIAKASDVHILPRYKSYSVLFRYLGVRRLAHEGDLEEYNHLVARIKDRARMDLAERRVPQDGGFQLEHNGRLVDMRVATLPTPDGEAVVIRLLDPDRVQPNLDGLGITHLEDWRAGVSRSDGLCLICGPTGSGKTTTLNATVKEMDRFGKAVYTVEDPVEYRISFTGQTNTNPSVGLDFARAVRAFMRSDPDVVVLGEVRDPETARNAIKAAETGHLVLATLHTGSIRGAIDRLRDLGVEERELRYILRSVMVQRLMRTVCTNCGGDGCDACMDTGYAGRTVVSESAYFPGVDEVNAMMEGQQTWATMLDDGVLKVMQGQTNRAELVRVFGVEAQRSLDAALQDTPEEA